VYVRELLTLGNGLATDLAGGVDIVLSLDRSDYFGRGHSQFRHLVGLNPHAQRVRTAENLHTRNASHTGDLVLKIDDRIVGQKILAQSAAGGVNSNQH
jgi:hypothetical protein